MANYSPEKAWTSECFFSRKLVFLFFAHDNRSQTEFRNDLNLLSTAFEKPLSNLMAFLVPILRVNPPRIYRGDYQRFA